MLEKVKENVPGVRIGALSNACGRYVEAVLEANKLSADFGIALGADQVRAAKPQPDGLLSCCEHLGVSPSYAVYVGDSPTDGQAAAAAGMPSIGVTWGSHPAENVRKAFTYTVDTVDDLQSVLIKLLSTIE